MKRVIIILLAFVICLSLCGCGKNEESNKNTDTVNKEPATEESIETTTPTESVKKKTVAESYPVIVLDNEYVKITIEDKFNGGQQFMDFGYSILIENKCDKYVMVVPTNCNVDGFMLPLSETPFVDTNKVGPGMKAKTFMFYMNASNNNTVKTVEDLVNFDGQWQLAFSEDGSTWKDFQNFNFEYILP